MNKAEKAKKIFETFKKYNPTPKTELNYCSPFELLIAVILSAQATDVSVNKATASLFRIAPDAQSMVRLGIDGIIKHIHTIGLFNSKAKNIYATAKILEKQYSGAVPNSRAELEKLPGVGAKTAGVVMNVLYNAPTLPVDTHVYRVSNRLGLVKTKSPVNTEATLIQAIPPEYLKKAHHWLILHGRYICKARNPKCHECLISQWCDSKNIMP